MPLGVRWLVLLAGALAAPPAARAGSGRAPRPPSAPAARALAPPTAAAPLTAVGVVAPNEPLTVHVIVPLCDRDLIDCGGGGLGDPGSLRLNLYWGALFGARRFFDRKESGWERVGLSHDVPDVLERAVYRRSVAGARSGRAAAVEQLAVLDAWHGARIDEAVDGFWRAATMGESIDFDDGGRRRHVTVHVVGYAGHNRLMDGKRLPAVPSATDPGAAARPIASFVLACHSERYFASALEAAGSRPLVTTRGLMAPEGYVVEATVRGLGDNLSAPALRAAVVQAYARYQNIAPATAARTFAPAR